jgi:hypothetical protein
MSPLGIKFHLREQEKITEGVVRREGKVGDDCHMRRSQKLLHNERRVSRNAVMMLGPGVVAPLLWKFVLDVLT